MLMLPVKPVYSVCYLVKLGWSLRLRKIQELTRVNRVLNARRKFGAREMRQRCLRCTPKVQPRESLASLSAHQTSKYVYTGTVS